MYSLYKQLHMGRRLHRRQNLLRMLVKTIFNRGHLVLYGIVLSIEYFVSKFQIRHNFELLYTYIMHMIFKRKSKFSEFILIRHTV